MIISETYLQDFIARALDEDVGPGDYSTLAAVSPDHEGRAQLLVKDEGILAGVELAAMIFRQYDPGLVMETFIADGSPVAPGQVAFRISGKAQSILTTERLVLNCMQRMSGIATRTAQLARLLEGTKAKLMDTRKTTPNFRLLEKWAVRIGGGHNHRMGLYDLIMLKDNHIDLAGGIKNAVEQTKSYLRDKGLTLKIEVETRNLDEVAQVLACGGVDIIMLDNMSVSEMTAAVNLIDGRCLTEASGGLTEETIRPVADCGVDWISVGALTHSLKSLDLSLKAC